VALADVSLDLTAGSFVALTGESGSGKSTRIRTISRLVDQHMGIVQIGGVNVRDSAPPVCRRRSGHVIQGVGLFPHMTVAANIATGLQIAGTRENAARVDKLLDLVDLPRDFARRAPDTLSAGQQQRVGVARALATVPGLVPLDEPLGTLDPVTRDALAANYRELRDRLGLTSIMVTHDMAGALLKADCIIVLKAGRIAADATPAELLPGGGGDAAQALVAVPKGQAERMAALVWA
jgi:osmoprotectant transport system ATP-binding protein